MDGRERALLGWIGVAVGLAGAVAAGGWAWLARGHSLPGDLRLIAAGLGLLLLVMALRCAAVARAR